MGAIASEITSLTIVYSTDYSGAYKSKHQSSTHNLKLGFNGFGKDNGKTIWEYF